MSSLKYCLCQRSKGGAIYRVVDGSLNFRILFIRLAALVLFGSFCGSKPITAILDCGNLLEIKLTVLQMVFAIVSSSLLLLFLKLFNIVRNVWKWQFASLVEHVAWHTILDGDEQY